MNESDVVEAEPFVARVIDLKQYVYCPRVAYYHLALPAVRPVTYKMRSGIEQQAAAEDREQRRSLRTYGLKTGERAFNMPLWSARLGLSGELDMLLTTDEELIAVDYKDTAKVGAHFRLQLMAYGRLLEENQGQRAVRRGFLYLIPLRKAVEVTFTPRLRQELATALMALRAMAVAQYVPPPTLHRARCVDCEFRRFCNDVT
jgi:CRISPR-associated exonuclease Cas4